MLCLHDFKCELCKEISEELVEHSVDEVNCRCCGNSATKTFEQFGSRKHLSFPEGDWHCLPEVDGHSPEVRSRRQLREFLKTQVKDEYTERYAVYDDGYAGY